MLSNILLVVAFSREDAELDDVTAPTMAPSSLPLIPDLKTHRGPLGSAIQLPATERTFFFDGDGILAHGKLDYLLGGEGRTLVVYDVLQYLTMVFAVRILFLHIYVHVPVSVQRIRKQRQKKLGMHGLHKVATVRGLFTSTLRWLSCCNTPFPSGQILYWPLYVLDVFKAFDPRRDLTFYYVTMTTLAILSYFYPAVNKSARTCARERRLHTQACAHAHASTRTRTRAHAHAQVKPVLLLDIFTRLQTATIIIKSVWDPIYKLASAGLVVLIVAYIFAMVIFLFHRQDMHHEAFNNAGACETLGSCWWMLVNMGIRSGGGVGDVRSRDPRGLSFKQTSKLNTFRLTTKRTFKFEATLLLLTL